MLFSSYVFILLFLPITLIGFALCSPAGTRASMLWLLIASAFFYGFWNPIHLPLFAASALINFGLGRFLRTSAPKWQRNTALAGGVAANLAVISYYKYAGFFAEVFAGLTGAGITFDKVILPLGISFFTFQQIGYLVDTWRHQVRPYTLLEYAFFVMFFPHLIAGPVVQHNDLLDQVEGKRTLKLHTRDLAVGLVIFVLGLMKKVAIADSIQPFVGNVFGTAAAGHDVGMTSAWVGVLAYTLQLYFDFSGYSDMAIGLARMFSFQLPLNFNSPYKATSIIDFWRRWHITLSVFLRDYLYIPLGGSRCGPVRRYTNLLITMTLGGLWHGAGWTFILWGAFHGGLLCVNHGWNAVKKHFGWGDLGWAGRTVAWGLTFTAVVVGWVLFRAERLETAQSLLASMFGFVAEGAEPVRKAKTILLGLLGLLGATVLLPNTQQLLARFEPALGWKKLAEHIPPAPAWMAWYSWQPSAARGALLAVGFVGVVAMLTRVKEFLYFQF
ncbi:MBOAT family O-acyltransferase [Planctomyces sp. SH-PL14]|uniref:MBOAT family O-acyltransferase n=1 Tax=Planctomyces sp. SH-PL14 TaxID=1632864 RepID=UPI00078DBAE0|nr:MBOAT family protein [Planctomyces sp. SH-PL14]AMV21492.1 Peptidoglycan O-acetyltransferase [Planctomyces sp. SH-PL14]